MRCKILKMECKKAPKCDFFCCGLLGGPRRWGWLAPQWLHWLLKSDVCIWFEFSFALFSSWEMKQCPGSKADIHRAVRSLTFECLLKLCLLIQLAKTLGYVVKMARCVSPRGPFSFFSFFFLSFCFLVFFKFPSDVFVAYPGKICFFHLSKQMAS